MALSVFPAPSTGPETYTVSAPYTFNGNPTATITIPAGTYLTQANPSGMSLISGTDVIGGTSPGVTVIDNNLSSVVCYDYYTVPTPRTFSFSSGIRKIIFAGGQFVAIGSNSGNIATVNTSSDSFNWVPRSTGMGSNSGYSDIAFGNGIYIAVGYGDNSSGPLIQSSTNGITWTTRNSNFGTSFLNAAAFGNNTYIAGGNSGGVTTSPDAATWTLRSGVFGANNLNFITFGAGVFLGGATSGDLRTSTNGVTWTTRTGAFGTNPNFQTGTFGGGLFVVAGGGSLAASGIQTSTDGITWTLRDSTFGSLSINYVDYSGSIYTAGGQSGVLAISTNGVTWQRRPSGIANNNSLVTSAFGNNFCVIASNLLSNASGTSFEPGNVTLTRVSTRALAS